jgi:LmbE family N-acetylglucosaminyl deacetylase
MNKLFTYCVLFLFLFLSSFINGNAQTGKKKIMAVFAHPDDETSIGPLLAKYANEGHDIYLTIATKGELGVTKHANIPAGDSLASKRTAEAICACEKLGIKPPIFLGLGDGSLAKDSMDKPLHQKLDSIFKLYQPDVVLTWGPDGGYGHMDHRMVHAVVTELLQAGEYSKEPKLFYAGVPTEHTREKINFQTDEVKKSVSNWKPVKKEYLTVRIPYSKQAFEQAQRALQCHQSQFFKRQMEDLILWKATTEKDTIYLRPFLPLKSLSRSIF